ncbi:MAG: DUF1553 domain-containing protein, partial [Planctomycetaceae bacterium]|nr:DUF1553 domain-containing protein [Planctomycetaceae bacterium]
VLTPDQSAAATRIMVYDLSDESKPIADASASLGKWGSGPRDNQGIWLDIKESGDVILDDLQFKYGVSEQLTFDFESPELSRGISVVGRDGWTNAVFSGGSARVHVTNRADELPEIKAALQVYRTALLNQSAASLDYRLAEAQLSLARANLVSLQKRIAADDSKYANSSSDNAADSSVSRSAAEAERGAKYAAAQLALLQAEREVVTAELAHLAASSKPGDQLAKAISKCEAARDSLKSMQSAELKNANYTPLSPQYPTSSTGRRAALARWLVHDDQPLTPRVAVNHLWMRHFGRGLVETPFDFGRRGKAPSHPELLDWLAAELRDHNWSMKHLHRLMVTSRTYRSTSRPGDALPTNLTADKENRLYWRFNSYRVEAEVVRDSVLAASGLLDPQLGGHEIEQNLGLDVPRRSLYFAHHGETIMQFLALFDPANPVDCYERKSSVQPQQALAQTNSTLTIGAARRMAGPLYAELKGQNLPKETLQSEVIKTLFQRILNRTPNAQETAIGIEFLNSQTELLASTPPTETTPAAATETMQKETPMPSANAGIGLDKIPPASDPELRAVENLTHALFNHNDFFTVR